MIRRRICVVTGSRAEYGLLTGLIKEIAADPRLELQMLVTGMHLEKKFGLTYHQILKDGFKITAKVPMGLKGDTDSMITAAAGRAVIGFSKILGRLRPDIVVVLGDRFETLSIALATTLMRIPLAHIHGGEVTEGAYDDIIRHAVTKMAHLHFVTHEKNAERIIQMGEESSRIFNVGAPGLDNIHRLSLLSQRELEKRIDFKLDEQTALVTFHPVTMQKGSAKKQVQELLLALKKLGIRCLFTMPNADPENSVIRREIKVFVKTFKDRSKAVESLGSLRYLSLMQYVALMVGNSSSGIIEAPSFKLPVVNIGDRQKGRLRAANVIDVPNHSDAIIRGIKKAYSLKFRQRLKNLKNPYGEGIASERIKEKLKSISLEGLYMKPFIDYGVRHG